MEENLDDLHCQGITVDNNNKPAPKNADNHIKESDGQWEKPTFCPQRMTNVPNMTGLFVNHCWDEIAKMAEMNKLKLFWMCFLEKYIVKVIIPTTNEHLDTPLMLQEFYIWLGCIFLWHFMGSWIAMNGGQILWLRCSREHPSGSTHIS